MNYIIAFSEWVAERVDFDTQNDEEILKILIESQEQNTIQIVMLRRQFHQIQSTL